jgi:predicted membrane protein
LTHLQPVTTTTTIHAKLGVGKLHIIVPRDLPVAVDAHAKVGQLDVLQQHEGGHNIDVSTPGRALLVIDAKVGAGQVDVERVTR